MASVLPPPGLRLAVIVALMGASLNPMSTARGDPVPTLSISSIVNGTVVISWLGVDGVPYKLQWCTDLATWSDVGLALIGTGNPINVPFSTAGQPRGFFRHKPLTNDQVSAVFDLGTGVLTIIGGPPDEVIVVSRSLAGAIRVNGGMIPITGGTPTVGNTTLIYIIGEGGNDELILDESNGVLPHGNLSGEGGDDVLTGGSGADVLNGGLGNDTLRFNGSAAAEIYDVSANGSRVIFFRNVGSIVMDINDIENLDVNALGGADTLTVNNLAGTDLTSIDVNLASTIGGATGDGAIDTVNVNGTNASDVISLTANGGAVEVAGLAALVRILNAELAFDDLVASGLGGADTFIIGPGVTTLIDVTTID